MARILPRNWLVPTVLVAVAALLTVPWSAWVIMAAYERDVNEKARMLAKRVEIQLSTPWYLSSPQRVIFRSPQHLLEPLSTELLGDQTVQAVCFLDYSRNTGGYVRKNDAVPVPRSLEEAQRMLNADPNSYRKAFTVNQDNGMRGLIYLDLSKAELKNHFMQAYWPLLRNVSALTATGFLIISITCLFAYHLWGRASRQQYRAELEQAGLLAERGLTAAVLAHEIRNPLAALRFQLESLRRNNASPERVTTTAETIQGELIRIQNLVQDYLAHEKAQAMHVEPVELAEAVRSLQTLMEELLAETQTHLLVLERQRQVVVACDPAALRQVLMNLVLNAQQAMGFGGIIRIGIGQEEGFGTISVADTGPGIPPEIRERLFKPFATSKKDGSGIGLALVKRFVDNFGGSVSVESEEGQGATFYLKLPLVGSVDSLKAVESVAVL